MNNSIRENLKKYLVTPAAAVILVVIVGLLAFWQLPNRSEPTELTLSEFQAAVEKNDVKDATLGNSSNEVTGELANGDDYRVVVPIEFTDELTASLLESDVPTEVDNESSSLLSTLLSDFLPTFLIIGVFLWFVLQMQGGGRKNIGQLNTKRNKFGSDVTFDDVAGADEALEELGEIKSFLEAPDRFSRLGAKIPSGVLLVGPPGTGKTLLAKAVAGEAGVPFFTISGSDFVEMFVGVGAARVRDLFKQAKAVAPSIVFVDEIDAVGRHRGAGVGGGHDEREQTLNQLLVEMDGFASTAGVILMAATNRPDVLDPALLRPGRFDRQIVVDAPDRAGREAILNVHARNKSIGPSVDLAVLARRTPGFTGADLANVINEAALMAGRYDAEEITMDHVNEAIDRVMAGPERKSRVMSDKEKRVTAYHEGGHALAGHLLPHADPIHKVSIVARGRALGWTLSLPLEDRHTHSRSELESRLAMLMGGRIAEELVFGEVTTGAADDIDQATRIARSMVTEFGMSRELGPQRLSHGDDEPFLGRDRPGRSDYSDDVASKVDSEVKALLDNAQATATDILTSHRATLDSLAEALMTHETLGEDELVGIFAAADAMIEGTNDD